MVLPHMDRIVVGCMIRNKVTGLYSTGGSYPSWRKKGKVWSQKRYLKSHITSLIRTEVLKHQIPFAQFYANAEIVEVLMGQTYDYFEFIQSK